MAGGRVTLRELTVAYRDRVAIEAVSGTFSPGSLTAIVLLDEPFAGVDASTSEDLLQLVRCWQGEGRTVLVALHNLEQVRSIFPETLLLARKAIAWGETAAALTPENLVEAGLAVPPRGAGPRLRLAMPS